MNKTININLAGVIFHLDDSAFEQLTDYLSKLKKQFKNQEGGDEILTDIEARIAEIFTERLAGTREVVSVEDVQSAIAIMGQPEDYADADDDSTSHTEEEPTCQNVGRKLYRDTEDNILGGVASGLAHYFNTDPVWLRLIFLLLLFGGGFGFWAYIILWIVIPGATTTAQKLQMKGEKINISNIEKSVKEQLKDLGEELENLGKKGSWKRTGNKIGNVIEDIVDGIISVLGSIFRVAMKIIGVALLIGGTIFLVIAFSAIVGRGIDLNGAHFGLGEAQVYLNAFLPEGYSHGYVWTASILTVLAPLVGLVYLGARILFNYKIKNRVLPGITGFLSFCGVVMWIILAFASADDFDNGERIRQDLALDSINKEMAIEIRAENAGYSIPHNGLFYIEDDEMIIDAVYFDIGRTMDTVPYIEVERESRGESEREAIEFAESIEMNVLQDGNILHIDRFLRVSTDQKYRGQHVSVTLYLPVGYSAYLSSSSRHIIHDIKNIEDRLDRHMDGHVWIMTEKGLDCADCSEYGGSSHLRSRNDFENVWIDEARKFEERRDNETEDEEEMEVPAIPSKQNRDTVPQMSAYIQVDTIGARGYTDSHVLI